MRIFKFLSLTLLSLAVTACSSNGNKSETVAADTDSMTVQAAQPAQERIASDPVGFLGHMVRTMHSHRSQSS